MTGSSAAGKLFALFLLALLPSVLLAVDDTDCVEDSADQCEQETITERPGVETLAGPEQVENRLDIDSNQVTPMFPAKLASGYFDWKARIKKNHGVTLGGDYSTVYLSASGSAGEDDTFGGMYRFYGSWSGGPRSIAYGYRAGRSAN